MTETLPISGAPVIDLAERCEERVWLDRCAQGDERAIQWILHRYRDRVVRLAAHVLRSPREAEDVAQEAFVKAFRLVGQFRGDAGFYAWLYRIVVNLCLDRMRRRHVTAETPLESLHADAHASPLDVDSRVVIQQLLDSLTPPIRAALVLREVEGLEYAEIAEVLQIPMGTVRSRLNTAREQFRSKWAAMQRECEHV